VREGLAVVLLTVACSSEPGSACGPTRAKVVAVTDGDTVTLADGEKIRYLLVDTNEITGGHNDCYGQEARILNEQLVLDKTIDLTYDDECRDRFGRLLAWVSVGGQSVNRIMVERGYACVLYIAPNGADERAEYEALEDAARAEHRGMWGACAPEDIACDQ
jgi:micrococcal nuclease